ncbi:hypothetical protein [Cohnella faecalis]
MREAMMIDGAGKWKTFIHLTLPMIAPGITVNVLIGLANGLRIFDLPFALTAEGRPGRARRCRSKSTVTPSPRPSCPKGCRLRSF